MIFWPLGFEGLWLALHVVLLRAVFCFAFLGTDVFISWGSRWGRRLHFFVPNGVPGSPVGSFLLCFACPPWLPLRPGAYVDGLVGVFLGLSVEVVWARLIIWTTLVPLITISHFSNQFVVLLFFLMSPPVFLFI